MQFLLLFFSLRIRSNIVYSVNKEMRNTDESFILTSNKSKDYHLRDLCRVLNRVPDPITVLRATVPRGCVLRWRRARVVVRDHELNFEHTYRSGFSNFDRRSIQKNNETTESQQEELHRRSSRRISTTISTTFSYSIITAKIGNYVKLMIKVSIKWMN